jgi:hypothetical protein
LSILLFASCHLASGQLLFRDSISVHISISAQSKKLVGSVQLLKTAM